MNFDDKVNFYQPKSDKNNVKKKKQILQSFNKEQEKKIEKEKEKKESEKRQKEEEEKK